MDDILLDEKYQYLLDKYTWNRNPRGYLQTHFRCPHRSERFTVKLHKMVRWLEDGKCPCENVPEGMNIAHLNHNRNDNRIENLQLQSATLNNSDQPKKPTHTSQYTGVSFYKPSQRWVAQIQVNGKMKNLRRFDTEIEAARARDQYVLDNGLNHKLNFPPPKIKIEIKIKIENENT